MPRLKHSRVALAGSSGLEELDLLEAVGCKDRNSSSLQILHDAIPNPMPQKLMSRGLQDRSSRPRLHCLRQIGVSDLVRPPASPWAACQPLPRCRLCHNWRLARRCARRKPGVLFRGSRSNATARVRAKSITEASRPAGMRSACFGR
jgi:hypothetical protein